MLSTTNNMILKVNNHTWELNSLEVQEKQSYNKKQDRKWKCLREKIWNFKGQCRSTNSWLTGVPEGKKRNKWKKTM